MSDARRIAFVSPRFSEGQTVGGAETLLKQLALRATSAGREVTYLTTCARNHFTWENELPPGEREIEGLNVHFFPVDADRDVETFLRVQNRISHGVAVSKDEELQWLSNSVNSRALCEHLRDNADAYDCIIMGPYLYGLVYYASQACPEKTFLVPCLHDEPFAYLNAFKEMCRTVRGILFNSVPERDLACSLYGLDTDNLAVVGMGLTPFDADPSAFAQRHGIKSPYLLYCGRREPMKGTPMLLDYVDAFVGRTQRDISLVFTGTGDIHVPPTIADRVYDVGFVSEQEKHEAMAGALAFCHPSAYESFSIVILESWLAGTPVLVTDKSEVMRFHCRKCNGGLWFRTYPEFEEEVVALMDNPALGAAMAENGKQYVRREYSWDSIDSKLFAAIDRS
jgi:glycosyltransferase involved in cell wall biosynthesis